jgi:electron transfer flavoprotein alpha subunit
MILIFAEHDQGEISPHSLETLSLGRQLAGQLGTTLEAILIGAAGREATEPLRQHGASIVHLIIDDRLEPYLPEAWSHGVAELVGSLSPHAVLAAGSDRGNELMAHVAAGKNLALAVNCQSVEAGDPFQVIRQRWGGSLLEETRLTGAIKLLTTAPNAFVAAAAPAAEITVHEVTPTLPESVFRVKAVPPPTTEADRISLGEARVVVGGGRGVGNAEGFRTLEELADMLGGAVGCSRAVTSLGWRPHAEQIGQTGERIAADLYIACGISGAMQHIVGAKGAKHILAINTDPDATIMDYADYAIIGDLHAVVPAIVEELKKATPA